MMESSNYFLSKLAKYNNNLKINQCPPENTSIYHYTSPTGIKNILEKTTLRFSDHNFMNDTSEGHYVLNLSISNAASVINDKKLSKLFIKECEKRQNQEHNVAGFQTLQCSFSTLCDSLELWNSYTKRDFIKGYNLHFDARSLIKGLKVEMSDNMENCSKVVGHSIVYDEEEQINAIRNLSQGFIDFYNKNAYSQVEKGIYSVISTLVDRIISLGIFFKNKCFEHEKEYRLVIQPYMGENGEYTTIENEQGFFEKNGIFIPYVDINFDPSALKGINISPTMDFNAARNSVLRLAQKNFSNEINDLNKIHQSDIPVRY